MRFFEILNQTLEEFDLSARAIAQESGVREAALSEYRRGKRDMHTKGLEQIIEALPPDAKQFFFLKLLVSDMDNRGIAVLLNAVANHLQETKTESTEPAQLYSSQGVLSLR